jgi:hypothetical protein
VVVPCVRKVLAWAIGQPLADVTWRARRAIKAVNAVRAGATVRRSRRSSPVRHDSGDRRGGGGDGGDRQGRHWGFLSRAWPLWLRDTLGGGHRGRLLFSANVLLFRDRK